VLDQILAFLSPMVLVWLAVLVVFMAVEAATVTLVSVWFCGGALVALIAAGLGAPLWLQVVLFLAVSLVLLALLAPFVRRVAKPRKEATNADRHVGRQALVTEEINNLQGTGAVKLDGVTWTARAEDQTQIIPVGSLITVRRITGAKAWVTLAEMPAQV